jgi:hypothetical protein
MGSMSAEAINLVSVLEFADGTGRGDNLSDAIV